MMDASVSEACARGGGGVCESIYVCSRKTDRRKRERESKMSIHTGTTTKLSLQDLTDPFVVEIHNQGGSFT